MMTEYESWLSPAKFMNMPWSARYFCRFQMEGMSVGPKVSSIGCFTMKYLVRFIASSRPRPQSGKSLR